MDINKEFSRWCSDTFELTPEECSSHNVAFRIGNVGAAYIAAATPRDELLRE